MMFYGHHFTKIIVAFCIFYHVKGATYPDNPDTDPPPQWSSMSNKFQQHCSPFGVSIFAQDWPRDKFIHACNVMAQMLDNDQDGCADDPNVVKKMRENQAGMAMFATGYSVNFDHVAESFQAQGLYASETELGCSGSSETANCRDAALEEILHVITGFGVGPAYPSDFSDCYSNKNEISKMQIQMDIARGGHFTSVPNNYPANAIFHYYDTTCEYDCMSTEFIYWALTSLLNGQGKFY